MHRYASDPAVLLEDLLHISLHYLEGVQVAHKHPEERTLIHLSTILLLPSTPLPPHLLFTAWGSWLLVWFPTLLTFILKLGAFSSTTTTPPFPLPAPILLS